MYVKWYCMKSLQGKWAKQQKKNTHKKIYTHIINIYTDEP